MSAEAHRALVRRFVDEFWSAGQFDAADELMTPDAIVHEPPVGSPAGLKAFARELKAAFPDWNSTVEEMIVEEDCVAERWTGRGTHRGEFRGIPPTGAAVAVPGVVFYRIRDGKISEFRGSFDAMSLMRQLGALPAPALATR